MAEHAVNWDAYPPLLTAKEIAEIYRYSTLYTKKLFQKRSDKVPTPVRKPWVVRKDDAKRHFERLSLGGR